MYEVGYTEVVMQHDVEEDDLFMHVYMTSTAISVIVTITYL